MKHINLDSDWKFSTTPFSAFRVELVYGRNKFDKTFLPCKDVVPKEQYTATYFAPEGPKIIYQGSSEGAAKEAGKEAEKTVKGFAWIEIKQTPYTLPENNFRVIKTKEKGTILIVPGEDTSARALVFVGCEGGFRGGDNVVKDATTCIILKQCSAANACNSKTTVAALFEPGSVLVFHTYGRRTNNYVQYTWDGAALNKVVFSKEEWESRMVVETDEAAEVL